ncbi:hypothetical protein F4809DRAFT_613045 [Biscogniauxia mediterranea]|nr:hypothetical protein F4809DRAFT_613045 [Biscogniauxia mediterranea]
MKHLQVSWNRTFRGRVSPATFKSYSTALSVPKKSPGSYSWLTCYRDYHHSRLANRSSDTTRPLNRPLTSLAAALLLLQPRINIGSQPTASCCCRRRHYSTTTTTGARAPTRTANMASNEDYMAFLDKANKDPSEGYEAKTTQQQPAEFKAADEGAVIPAAIQEATRDSFYVSDADEPFVPVYLAWDEGGKGLPDEEEFASLIHHPDPSKAEIEILDPADWDTQGQYKTVLDAVRKAGKGNDVRVYRVAKGGVRVEYWVVTTEGKGANAKLVGAKALAIES